MTGLLTYGQVHNVVAHLPIVLRNVRARRELSYRAAADEIGVSYITLWRLEQGRTVMVDSALLILAWLDRQHTALASAAVTAGIDAPAGQLRSTVKASLTPESGLADGRIEAGVVLPNHPVHPQRGHYGRDLDGGW